MCLALPMRIIQIDGDIAKAEVSGVAREISILTLPRTPQIGDFVLVHAGFAIEYVDEESAIDTLRVIGEISADLEDDGILPPY